MSTSWANACAIAVGSVLVLDVVRRQANSKRESHCPLPPGPRGLPFVGNVVGVNNEAPWLTYAGWAKVYGDLMYTQLLGKDIIIISSEKIANDLLERRSRNFSDRPSLVTNELFGMEFNSVLLSYGDRWRLHRRFFHQAFRADSVARFAPLLQQKSFKLLRQLLEDPSLFSEHIFEYTASIVMNAVYDYDPVSRKDQMVDIVKKAIDVILYALRPDVSILIGAFPGSNSISSILAAWDVIQEDCGLFEDLDQRLCGDTIQALIAQDVIQKSGSSGPGMVCDALRKAEEEDIPADSEWIRALKEAAATAFMAASETSNASIVTVFLMMVMFPEAQEKAQAQIDAVIGRDRLPILRDRPSLPYIDALLRETMRYNTVSPLSVPHVAVDADTYEGYYIPKGALMISNLWAMAHNESKYPQPFEFHPERFLNADGTLKPDDTQNITFGFGRRICVGRHFADTGVWSAVAMILAVFRLSKPKDEDGVEVPVEPKFTSGLAVHPLPFPCSISPRIKGMDAAKLEQLITASSL